MSADRNQTEFFERAWKFIPWSVAWKEILTKTLNYIKQNTVHTGYFIYGCYYLGEAVLSAWCMKLTWGSGEVDFTVIFGFYFFSAN